MSSGRNDYIDFVAEWVEEVTVPKSKEDIVKWLSSKDTLIDNNDVEPILKQVLEQDAEVKK